MIIKAPAAPTTVPAMATMETPKDDNVVPDDLSSSSMELCPDFASYDANFSIAEISEDNAKFCAVKSAISFAQDDFSSEAPGRILTFSPSSLNDT